MITPREEEGGIDMDLLLECTEEMEEMEEEEFDEILV